MSRHNLLVIDDHRLVDMHVHTHHSDGQPSIVDVEERCLRENHGAIITDHNEIRGSVSLFERGRVPTLAGIEVGTEEGFEFLTYFDSPAALEEFYVRAIEPYLLERFMVRSKIKSLDALACARDLGAWITLAHPFAFGRKSLRFQEKKRGQGFCDAVLEQVDALELFNGGIPKGANRKAETLIHAGKLLTSGSDSHVLDTYGTSGVWFPRENESAQEMLAHLQSPEQMDLQTGHHCSVARTVMMIAINHTKFFMRGRTRMRLPSEVLADVM